MKSTNNLEIFYCILVSIYHI